jgi:hypothetical protein
VFWSFVFWILWVFGVWNLEFGMLGLGILDFFWLGILSFGIVFGVLGF